VNRNLHISFFIAIIYLIDEKINQFFEINGIGFLLVFVLFLFVIVKNNIQISLSLSVILFTIIFYFYEIIVIFLSPCSINLKTIFSLILILPYLVLLKSGFILKIILNQKLNNFIIIITLMLLLIHSIGGDFYRPFRAQYEYSWTALYICPFIIFNLLKNNYHKLSLFAIIILIFTSLSSTLLIILIILIFYISIQSRRFLILFPFSLILPLAFLYYIETFYERVQTIINYSNVEIINLSSLVWLNGFSMASNYFQLTNGLGVGFNSMGCSNDVRFYGNYMDQITSLSGSTLNILDGSFIASKLISEFGVIGFLLVIYLTIKCIQVLLNGIYKNIYLKNMDFINIAGAMLIITFLYIRGGGYYQLGFFISLSMLFACLNKKSKNLFNL
jgi:hypothetical protein